MKEVERPQPRGGLFLLNLSAAEPELPELKACFKQGLRLNCCFFLPGVLAASA